MPHILALTGAAPGQQGGLRAAATSFLWRGEASADGSAAAGAVFFEAFLVAVFIVVLRRAAGERPAGAGHMKPDLAPTIQSDRRSTVSGNWGASP